MKYLGSESQFFYSISQRLSHGWNPNFAVLPIIDYKQWTPINKSTLSENILLYELSLFWIL